MKNKFLCINQVQNNLSRHGFIMPCHDILNKSLLQIITFLYSLPASCSFNKLEIHEINCWFSLKLDLIYFIIVILIFHYGNNFFDSFTGYNITISPVSFYMGKFIFFFSLCPSRPTIFVLFLCSLLSTSG